MRFPRGPSRFFICGGGVAEVEMVVAAEVVSAPALSTKRNFDLSRILQRTYRTAIFSLNLRATPRKTHSRVLQRQSIKVDAA